MKYSRHVDRWLKTAQNVASVVRTRTQRVTRTLRDVFHRHRPTRYRPAQDAERHLSTWVRPVLGAGQHHGLWHKAAEPIVLVTALAWILALAFVGVAGLATFALAFGLIFVFLTQVFGISVDPIFRTPQ